MVRSLNRKRRLAFVWVLVVTILTLLLTSPLFISPGDNFATRTATVSLLTTGEYGISYSRKEELAKFVEHRGQYFFENDAQEKLYPKYGVAYSLLYVPPMFVEQAFAGHLELIHNSGSLVILLNLYNLLFAALIVTYVWKLASLYSRHLWLTVMFVLSSVFGTFLWFYLRTHSHDIFQIAAFIAFAYHALVFLRMRTAGERVSKARGAWLHLLVSTLCLGLLLQMRFSFALLYAPLIAFALTAGRRSDSIPARFARNLSTFFAEYSRSLLLPTGLGLGLLFLAQWWKFGSMFDHGYGQWEKLVDNQVLYWPLETVVRTLAMYFVAPGNGNVFLHYPLLAFALIGWFTWRQKHPSNAAFAICASACILLPVLNWGTEGHGYGPRYLLPAAVLCAPPLLLAYERLHRWRLSAGVTFVCVLAMVVVWSSRMQVHMNSLPTFSYFYAAELFLPESKDLPESKNRPAPAKLRAYFKPLHRGSIARDLAAHRQGGQEFPPISILLSNFPESRRDAIKARLNDELRRSAAPNYLFSIAVPTASVASGD